MSESFETGPWAETDLKLGNFNITYGIMFTGLSHRMKKQQM